MQNKNTHYGDAQDEEAPADGTAKLALHEMKSRGRPQRPEFNQLQYVSKQMRKETVGFEAQFSTIHFTLDDFHRLKETLAPAKFAWYSRQSC
jgi:hypothetical protein